MQRERATAFVKSKEKPVLRTCCTNWKVASSLPPIGIPWVCYCFYTPWNSPTSSSHQQEVAPVPKTGNPISGFSKLRFQTEPFTMGRSSPHALFPAPWTWAAQTLRSSLDRCPASAPMCCLRKGVSTTSPGSESQAGTGSKRRGLKSLDQISYSKEKHACLLVQTPGRRQ